MREKREKREKKRLEIVCEDISGMHFRALNERNALLGTVQQKPCDERAIKRAQKMYIYFTPLYEYK